MKKIIALASIVLFLSLVNPSRVFAKVIFEEHFDNGDSSNWTPVSNSNL